MSAWSVPVAPGTSELVLRTPTVSNAWQVGTILKAVALTDSVNGRVQLQIGARTIHAQSSLPLQSGQTLRLAVAETGRTVILRTVNPARLDQVPAAIRAALPRQNVQGNLVAAAVNLSKNNSLSEARLTGAVEKLLFAVRDARTLTQGQGLRLAVRDAGNFLEKKLALASGGSNAGTEAVSPRDWKAALLQFRSQLARLHSGLQQSAGLKTSGTGAASVQQNSTVIPAATAAIAKTTTPLPPAPALPAVSDKAAKPAPNQATAPAVAEAFKMQPAPAPPMRHMLPQAQPVVQAPVLPTELLSLVGELLGESEGALTRVRLNQLGSITPEHSNRMVWLLELPVRHANNDAEVVTLRIEQDNEPGSSSKQAAWTADLAFDLGHKGELRARVALRAGQIAVTFWADTDQTRAEVSGNVSRLQSAMEEKQLKVGCVSCGASMPPAEVVPRATLLETQA